MSSREVPFDDDAVCDDCGCLGAYDFMGDNLCPTCALVEDEEAELMDDDAEDYLPEEEYRLP